MATFTVTDASMNLYSDGSNLFRHIDYTLHEANGAVFKIRRTRVNYGIGKIQISPIPPAVALFNAIRQENNDRGIPDTAQVIQKFGKRSFTKKIVFCEHPVVSKVLIQAAAVLTPAVQNPYQIVANTLQNQLAVSNQTNTTLQQTVAQQNQDIASLRQQAADLQNTITGLNTAVSSLRAQVAVIPALQTQISALEGQVANLTVVLNNILALITG